jgi:hypothetical protein
LKEHDILICRVEILLKFINPKKKKQTNSDQESGHNNPRRGKVGYCTCYGLHDFKGFYYLSDLPTVVVLM